MPTTDVDLVNQSLLLLGASPLTSLADDLTDTATICRSVYPPLRDNALSSYSWRFGLRRRELTRDATTPVADGGWRYSFILPGDRLSGGAFAAFQSDAFDNAPFKDWSIVGDRLVSSAERIWVEYPKQATEADFPPYFINFMVAALCAHIAFAITDQQNTAAHWHRVAYGTPLDRDSATITGGALLDAQITDAQQYPMRGFEGGEVFDLVAVRF